VFPAEPSFAVLPAAFPQPLKVDVKQSEAPVTFNTGQLQVDILKKPLRIIFRDSKGNVISQDRPEGAASFNGPAFRLWKSMPEDEHYFGLGDKAGPLDRRNMAFTFWNTDAFGWQESTDPIYKSIPFLLAMHNGSAYGLFLDNTYRSNFEFGKEFHDAFLLPRNVANWTITSLRAQSEEGDFRLHHAGWPHAVAALVRPRLPAVPLQLLSRSKGARDRR
jgi:alpha-glucosidase